MENRKPFLGLLNNNPAHLVLEPLDIKRKVEGGIAYFWHRDNSCHDGRGRSGARFPYNKYISGFPTVTKTGNAQKSKAGEDKGSGGLNWSGRGDLNPRQLAWEARTLPLSYARSRDQDSHSRCGLRLSQGARTFG